MRHHSRAFALSDMIAGIVLCLLILIYANVMIGCGGSEKDGKALMDGLKKATDDLNKASGEMLAATNELKTVADGLKNTAEVFEPIAEQIKQSTPRPSPRPKPKVDDTNSSDPSVRANARRMQNSTHTRGIHQGMVLYAQGNKDYYPGLTSNGAVATVDVAARDGIYGYNVADGTHVGYRLAVLLRGNYFSSEYTISPLETNSSIKALYSRHDHKDAVKDGGTKGQQMEVRDGASYSYAMLNISDVMAARVGEWRATINSRAAAISDRNIGSGASGADAQSVHTTKGQGWRGSVCYNDNHADFETSDVIDTNYNLKGDIAADRLFADTDETVSGVKNADAAMVFKVGNAYVNQQP